MKKNDPYSKELWSPKVDVIIKPPQEAPSNFYWLGKPAPVETYSDAPLKSECRLIRKPLKAFATQAKADEWAKKKYSVVETLHTARIFCWRVKNV